MSLGKHRMGLPGPTPVFFAIGVGPIGVFALGQGSRQKDYKNLKNYLNYFLGYGILLSPRVE
jgi:hypothetical protein